jgi:molecular chaperone DnaK (HSP70)
MSAWAMDLGTTNTGIAFWDPVNSKPRLLDLAEICRAPEGENELEAPRLIPSATHALSLEDFWTRMGHSKILAPHVFWGRWGYIGREALEMNKGKLHPNYVHTFKPYLGLDALRIVARSGKERFTARDVARIFMREVFAAVKRSTGERIRELVITTPVESFESYRAELVEITRQLGVKRLRFIDEPVAAAIGYGIGAGRQRLVLVVDFGGGTLDLALVKIDARNMESGQCDVLAKEGRAVGGNLVDHWIVEAFCKEMDFPLKANDPDEQMSFWYHMMLAEARRVKEAVFFNPTESFLITPPEEFRRFEARLRGDTGVPDFSREKLIEILRQNDMYNLLKGCLEGIKTQMHAQSMDLDDISDVLMVGGSTLLPGVFDVFTEVFGRDRVRAWQPFEAVAYGACAFAAGSLTQSDFIVHDYALRTYRNNGQEVEYPVVVPRGTRFPTPQDIWKRQFVPTCALGLPEDQFRLVICEIGRDDGQQRRFAWDSQGRLHKIGGTGSSASSLLVVPLNESNPTLGRLDPAHQPTDRRPRLEISVGVNADRWLSATVQDLYSKKFLMKNEPVVRLL